MRKIKGLLLRHPWILIPLPGGVLIALGLFVYSRTVFHKSPEEESVKLLDTNP
jgi:hypothetical protein